MATAENKVRFNLLNVHYAKRTAEGYATPTPIPGAVSLDLAKDGEITPFYADGVKYYVCSSNNGYTGTLAVARFPAQMLKDIFGFTEDANKVLIESADPEPAEFALLFQIDGDATPEYYVLYNVTGSRPDIGSKTNESSKTPVTQSIDITCAPDEDHVIKANTQADTPEETKTGWFKNVYKPQASEAA